MHVRAIIEPFLTKFQCLIFLRVAKCYLLSGLDADRSFLHYFSVLHFAILLLEGGSDIIY